MFSKYSRVWLIGLSVVTFSTTVQAESLESAVFRTIATHPEIKAQINRRTAKQHELRQAEAGYYPSVDLMAAAGKENSKNRFTAAAGYTDYVDLTRTEEAFVVTYNLFNGFSTTSSVDSVSANVSAAGHRLHNITEQIALQVADVYLRVLQYQQLVDLSQETLTEHERLFTKVKSRSRSGVGRRSDISQAMGRVDKARANLIADQTSLQNAISNYLRVTGSRPSDLSLPDSGQQELPANMQEAINLAEKNNPLIRAVQSDVQGANALRRESKSGYYPRVDLVFEQSRGENLDGIEGVEKDYSLMLKMRYNLFNGGYDTARSRQAVSLYQASQDNLDDIRRRVTETTQLAWNSYQSIVRQIPYLDSYVKSIQRTRTAYSDQFKIGKRSLLDLLDSENELYQARRSRIIAKYDRVYSGYRILANMGRFVDLLEGRIKKP